MILWGIYSTYRIDKICKEQETLEQECSHPQRAKEYFRNGCFKCWRCGKIVVEHNDHTEPETLEEAYLNQLIDEANKEWTLDRRLAKEVAIKYAKWLGTK